MAAGKSDFESLEFDGVDVMRDDARIDALEHAYDNRRHAAEISALQEAALQHAVDYCISSCLDCLGLLYLAREQKPITNIAEAHDSWHQEAEPEPCSRDSWLRGVVPETPLPPASQQHEQQPQQQQPKAERPPSALVNRKSGPGSVKSVKSQATDVDNRDRRPSATPRAPSQIQSVKSLAVSTCAAQQQVPGGSATAAVAATSGNLLSQSQSLQAPNKEQQNAEERLRQELQLRCQQEAISRELRQKDEQARAALQALQKDLKGKDYTYDSKGEVVLLAKVNPESLPAPPGPQFRVHTSGNAAAEAQAAAAAAAAAAGKKSSISISRTSAAGKASGSSAGSLTAGASSSSSSSNKSTKGAAKAVAAIAAARDFVPLASQAQPPLLETVKPTAGVTVKAGAAVKLGPKRDSTGGQQTRAQYQQQVKAQNQQAARIVAAKVPSAGHAVAGASLALSASGSSSISGRASGKASSTSGEPEAAAAAGGGEGGRGLAAPAAAELAYSSSQVGMASAIQPKTGSSYSGTSVAVAEGSGANGGPISQFPAAAAAGGAATCSRPDVNLVLVAAADWGQTAPGGYCPPEGSKHVHASDKQLKEEFGRTTYLPKLRAPVATLQPPKGQPRPTAGSKLLNNAAAGLHGAGTGAT